MQPSDPCPVTTGWAKSFRWLALTVAFFHAAYYASGKFPVAPVRAAEYGVPIFRLASSGISQAIRDNGQVIAQTKFQVNGDILAAKLRLPPQGTLPWDRWLAPACVAITGIVTTALTAIFLLYSKSSNC
jgi:apolipoprotein N-acyltransferase